jgi:hypothetical protein
VAISPKCAARPVISPVPLAASGTASGFATRLGDSVGALAVLALAELAAAVGI